MALAHAVPAAVVVGLPGSAFERRWERAFEGLVVRLATDADSAGERLRAEVHHALTGVAAGLVDVFVPAPYGDLDGWRQAAPEAFNEAMGTNDARASGW